MSQSDFGVIDPNTKSGTQLAVDLNGFRNAVNSGHSGATRPAYLPAGGIWVRIVSSTQWDLVLYDGAVNHTLRSINPATGQKIGIPAADLADKQTSATDNTAGRLLTVGAFGLGGASTYLTNLDLLTTQTGYYYVDGATTGTHPAVATFATVEVGRYSNSNSVYQVYRGVGNAGLAGRVFTRLYNGSSLTWLPWIEVATSASKFGVTGVRIDVASASTVNLTTAAPNTLHINITGGGTINGFTVAAGQSYFVRFSGAGVLTNNAALVTQSGANLTTADGDTCILRATAANVVEVLAYTPFAYPFVREYVSAEQVITAGGALTLTHGLGVVPKMSELTLVCKIAQFGYVAGDVAVVGFSGVDGAGASYGPTMVYTPTSIVIRQGANPQSILINDTAGVVKSITNANWRLIVRAWA